MSDYDFKNKNVNPTQDKKRTLHNEESIERLAKQIVDDWDQKTLVNYAIDNLSEYYKKYKEEFKRDWILNFE